MELPTVSLGELYSLLGEKDVRIYQLERVIEKLEIAATSPPEKKEDPFKKGK
jgi:hypothetical protein